MLERWDAVNTHNIIIERTGMEAEVGYGKSVYRALAMVTQFGINMLVPIFLCSFFGIYLDRRFGTSFWMVVLFFARGCRRISKCVYLRQKDIQHKK